MSAGKYLASLVRAAAGFCTGVKLKCWDIFYSAAKKGGVVGFILCLGKDIECFMIHLLPVWFGYQIDGGFVVYVDLNG